MLVHKSKKHKLKVGIIDSGINPTKLKNRRYAGGITIGIKDQRVIPFGDGQDDRSHGHGTMCALIIEKISPQTPLYSIKVMNSENKCSIRAIIEGIRWGIENCLNILNISIATNDITKIDELTSICEEAYRKNILIVASRENNGSGPSYPADIPTVIAVDYIIEKGINKKINPFHYNHEQILLCATVMNQKYEKLDWIWKEMVFNSYLSACISGAIAKNMARKKVRDIREVYTQLGTFI